MCSTAKKMWSTLTVMFEGCSTSMESTITTLTRRYERFFSLRNESLTDTHTCFNALVNDLTVVGITKKNEVLKSIFLDSLPPKWNNYISSVKLSSVYQDLDLPGLFGLLHNQECSEAEKLIAMGDSYSQPASALVASMTEHSSSISNEIIPCINKSVPVISNTNSICSESDCDESDGEDLANEVALLAERIRRRSFNKFKGKGRSGQVDKTKKPFDMSKVTCYKCGKPGHMVGDCRSKESSQAVPLKGGRNEKYSKLKTKYKALKAQVAELSKKVEKDEMSMIAKDWAESAISSDDEKYKDAKCFMAKEKFVEDLVKIQQQSESAHKAFKLNRLGDEVLLQKHFNQELKKEISILKQEVSSKNFTIEKLESEVKAQKQLNAILVTEAKTSEEKFLKIKHITESWCTGSKRAAKCVNVQKSGIGFIDPKKIGQTIAEAVSESDREQEKVRDYSVPKKKNKLLKNEKSDSKGNVVPIKSVSNPNHLKSDSDKIISKYVESRKGLSRCTYLTLGQWVFQAYDRIRVSYVNGLKHHLISVSQLCDAGYEVRFRSNKGIVLDLESNVVLIANRDESLYSFDMRNPTVSKEVCFMSKTQDELNWLWHKRLSHMNLKDINKLYKKELVSGLPVIKYEKDKLCGSCEKGKQHKASFKLKSCSTIDSCLDLLHMDLGRKPEIGFLRMFGSPCYILNQKDHLGKFDEKADEGILLGYVTMMKAYRVYNKRTNTIENSVNVSIDEGCSKPACSPPEDKDIDFEELDVPENEPPSNPPVENNDAQTQGEQLNEKEELSFFENV
uniref:uncharacterized protein LOC122610360 n=1 Tax=Erigeron canadensis TaxID=72917 RepID=UPI001CB9786B|nr:uncharacterized protein LOC122610360 [Erigeron canadensis]